MTQIIEHWFNDIEDIVIAMLNSDIGDMTYDNKAYEVGSMATVLIVCWITYTQQTESMTCDIDNSNKVTNLNDSFNP